MAGNNIWVDDETVVRPADMPAPSGDSPVFADANQPGDPRSMVGGGEDMWQRLASQAYEGSTTYWEANHYRIWQKNLSNFRSRHPPGSKYHKDDFKHRSRLFRPKTRASVRRHEAAANQAFFSTEDVVELSAANEDDPFNVLSAELRSELLNYRLTTQDPGKGIPWLQTLIGAYQDTRVMGSVCSCQEWKYEERENVSSAPAYQDGHPVFDGMTGEPFIDETSEVEIVADRPHVRLVPLENIRFHPAASWEDPVNTSPYFIELIPMYLYEVRGKMDAGIWYRYDNPEIARSRKDNYDTVRQEREGRERRDPYEEMDRIDDYTIIWVHRNILRYTGQDYVFHSLGTTLRLEEPMTMKEFVPHGRRPYVIGTCMIETHRTMPSAPAELTRGLQAEANEVVNQRIDNVRLVLQKRYLIRRGADVDTRALTRSVPGGGVTVEDINGDVRELEFDDVTASSHLEQDRINLDFDDIAGDFNSGSVQSNRALNETATGMNILNEGANTIAEHDLRIFAETWVEPVLAQIDLLELHLEDDPDVLAAVGRSSKMFRQVRERFFASFGVRPDPNNELLGLGGVSVKVNVGFGATNPQQRVNKLLLGTNTIAAAVPQALQRLNPEEFVNEIMGALGYKSGKRFFNFDEDQDPQVQQLQQQIQQLQQEIELEAHKARAKAEADGMAIDKKAQADLKARRMDNETRMEIARMQTGSQAYEGSESRKLERGRMALDARFKSADQGRERERMAFEQDRDRAGMERAHAGIERQRADLERGQYEQKLFGHERDRILGTVEAFAQRAAAQDQAMGGIAATLEALASTLAGIQRTSQQQAETLAGLGDRLDGITSMLDALQEAQARQATLNEEAAARRGVIEEYLAANATPEVQAVLRRARSA